MSRRDPVTRWQLLENVLVENDLLILAPQLSESGLQALSDRPEMSWDSVHAVRMLTFAGFAYFNSGDRSRLQKEVLDDFRHETPLLGFGRFAENR